LQPSFFPPRGDVATCEACVARPSARRPTTEPMAPSREQRNEIPSSSGAPCSRAFQPVLRVVPLHVSVTVSLSPLREFDADREAGAKQERGALKGSRSSSSTRLFFRLSLSLLSPRPAFPSVSLRAEDSRERPEGSGSGARSERGAKIRKRKEQVPVLALAFFSSKQQQSTPSSLSSFSFSSLSSLSHSPMHWSTGLRVTSPPTMARTSPALSWAIAA
jgi:hypothetical protein